jgi:hypothetical protein
VRLTFEGAVVVIRRAVTVGIGVVAFTKLSKLPTTLVDTPGNGQRLLLQEADGFPHVFR